LAGTEKTSEAGCAIEKTDGLGHAKCLARMVLQACVKENWALAEVRDWSPGVSPHPALLGILSGTKLVGLDKK